MPAPTDAPVRVRFAPSPTGFLHMGGARTALFNWLFARHHGGTFILRIEDTDQKRNREDSAAAIVEGMHWLGLDADEGPFYQSRRMDLYAQALARVEQSGHVYRCWCTEAELERKRAQAEAEKRKPLYDGTCRARGGPPPGAAADAPHVLRLRMPREGDLVVDDVVAGRVVFRASELDDWIVARSDGTPTYNFTVVVDDVDMRITHVIRGADHLANTPKQIVLYGALGATPPVFAHVPKVSGLSKRKGSPSIQAYRAMGMLPEAVVNYLARLAWSHGDQELFTREELVEKFTLEAVGKSPSGFDLTKMKWVNQEWLKRRSDDSLAALFPEYLARVLLYGPDLIKAVEELPGPTTLPWGKLPAIVRTLRERAQDLGALAAGALLYFRRPDAYDPGALKKWMGPGDGEGGAGGLGERMLHRFLAGPAAWPEPEFDAAALEAWFRAQADDLKVGLGPVCQPLRIALAGGAVSPPLFEVLAILGQTESRARVEACLRALWPERASALSGAGAGAGAGAGGGGAGGAPSGSGGSGGGAGKPPQA
jgi:glutamyl-tRNA synthetase